MSNQVVRFGEAIKAIINGQQPESYNSEYTRELASDLNKCIGPDCPAWMYGFYGSNRMIKQQIYDLAIFDVEFDTWFRESNLADKPIDNYLLNLLRNGTIVVYNEDTGKTLCGICANPRTELEPCSFCDEEILVNSKPIKTVPSWNYGLEFGVASKEDIRKYNSSNLSTFQRYKEDSFT